MNTDYKPFDPDFTPVEKDQELDRGSHKGYGYVITNEASGTVLYLNNEYNFLSAFTGDRSRKLNGKTVEIYLSGDQRVFCYKYGDTVSLETAKADVSSFVEAINIEERKYIQYCMTHD